MPLLGYVSIIMHIWTGVSFVVHASVFVHLCVCAVYYSIAAQ